MIIDFRGRPPTKEFLSYFVPERTTKINHRVGAREPAPSFLNESVELFFQEMDEAGIVRTVALGRNSPSSGANAPKGEIPNDHIAGLVEKYPGRIIGIAGIDVGGDIHDPIEETKRAVSELGLLGIHIEPARSSLGTFASDEAIYPVYELCNELDVPVVLMTGPFAGGTLEDTDPVHAQRVAADFPDLRIVLGHGCYPYVVETIAVAFKHQNIFVSPDVYWLMPGGHPYSEAANTFLQDQMLFGTAYPARPLGQTVEDYRQLPLTPDVQEKVFYTNAAKLLGIERADEEPEETTR